jgi:hypothetical protein
LSATYLGEVAGEVLVRVGRERLPNAVDPVDDDRVLEADMPEPPQGFSPH